MDPVKLPFHMASMRSSSPCPRLEKAYGRDGHDVCDGCDGYDGGF
jgi:hypothetical protein